MDFDDLKSRAHEIDMGIQKLEKTWKTPQNFMAGFDSNDEDPSPYVENFFSSIKEVQVNNEL